MPFGLYQRPWSAWNTEYKADDITYVRYRQTVTDH